MSLLFGPSIVLALVHAPPPLAHVRPGPLINAQHFLALRTSRVTPRCESPRCDAAAATALAAKAAALFNNVRTPAALAAGACLNLGFGAVPTDRELTPTVRLLKRLVIVVGFLSLTSELLAVLMCTNAVNRLSMDVALRPELFEYASSSNRPIFSLLSSAEYRTFWVGTYLHFVAG